jgi:uncharacterized protein (DUF433 family)
LEMGDRNGSGQHPAPGHSLARGQGPAVRPKWWWQRPELWRNASAGRMIPLERRVERITINPNRMRGLPCIRDTRVTVSAVLGQLAAGRTIDQVLEDYPYLEVEDILAALSFAAEAMQERELPLAQPA